MAIVQHRDNLASLQTLFIRQRESYNKPSWLEFFVPYAMMRLIATAALWDAAFHGPHALGKMGSDTRPTQLQGLDMYSAFTAGSGRNSTMAIGRSKQVTRVVRMAVVRKW